MALTFEFEEEYRNSRGISVTETSFQQDFIFYICGNFLDEAIDDPDYGPDDDIVALRAAYTIIPPYRSMPLYSGGYILLTLSNLSVDQVDNDTWKVSVGYTARPIDQSPGGLGSGGTGPAVGDRGNWSNNFVQLGFNVSSQQEQQTESLKLLNVRRANKAVNVDMPYTPGKPAPVGHTMDGVEGYQSYVRSFSFNITAYFPPQRLTFAYVRRLYRMATTVNDRSFFGFPGGSVLFLEASASGDLYSVVPVTFEFQMRPNYIFRKNGYLNPDNSYSYDNHFADPSNDNEAYMFDTYYEPEFEDSPDILDPFYNISTGFPGNAYSGWSIIDYRYMHTVDTASKMDLQKPILRMIHQVYEKSNFNLLEL